MKSYNIRPESILLEADWPMQGFSCNNNLLPYAEPPLLLENKLLV
jgi:hypothetical protein